MFAIACLLVMESESFAYFLASLHKITKQVKFKRLFRPLILELKLKPQNFGQEMNFCLSLMS
ncbi:CLUMA_CG014836, isoform A [Clunio marinus]|uniref:CLUMA_CG014836, isoform A n=1 Tax=Clunio marinus TaxID=568069 RepID=A0A1J1IMS6_9DIPT|nr:CLUMA_CG014836, isoform A [Clunio marinus]